MSGRGEARHCITWSGSSHLAVGPRNAASGPVLTTRRQTLKGTLRGHVGRHLREMRWWCDAGGACLLILSDHLRGLPCWVSLSGRVVARRTYWSLALDFHLLAHCTLYPAPLSEVFLPRHSLFVYSETQDRTEDPAPISCYRKSLLLRAPRCPDCPAP